MHLWLTGLAGIIRAIFQKYLIYLLSSTCPHLQCFGSSLPFFLQKFYHVCDTTITTCVLKVILFLFFCFLFCHEQPCHASWVQIATNGVQINGCRWKICHAYCIITSLRVLALYYKEKHSNVIFKIYVTCVPLFP
jgi:hypothetical protein